MKIFKTMEQEILKYCQKQYNETYTKTKRQLEAEALENSRSNKINDTMAKKIETSAQLLAIKATIISGRLLYPHNIPLLWASIYRAHLYRKSGISDPDVVTKVIMAEQSWRASSGHAFEYMTKELANLALYGTPIRFLLQRDLTDLIREGKLANEERDLVWLQAQTSTDNFDLYTVGEDDSKLYCFGCVQCKTSIRDRVSRDRELSSHAMMAFFWSVSFVIDGTQLTTPKYIAMANGGTETFKTNGWHALYDLSATIPGDRIYALDMDFNIIRDHAQQAFHAWRTQRQWFTAEWRAQ